MKVENLYKGGMAVRRLWVWTGLAAAMAALRWVPGLAALWRDGVSLPALRTLNRWTGALPFPLAEPLALVLLGTALAALRRRPRRPLRQV